ncbi:hypothetical protein, partial [Reinekea sp. G2M2-21]
MKGIFDSIVFILFTAFFAGGFMMALGGFASGVSDLLAALHITYYWQTVGAAWLVTLSVLIYKQRSGKIRPISFMRLCGYVGVAFFGTVGLLMIIPGFVSMEVLVGHKKALQFGLPIYCSLAILSLVFANGKP